MFQVVVLIIYFNTEFHFLLALTFSGPPSQFPAMCLSVNCLADSFLDTDVTALFADHFKANGDDLVLDLGQMKRMIQRKTANGTMPR